MKRHSVPRQKIYRPTDAIEIPPAYSNSPPSYFTPRNLCVPAHAYRKRSYLISSTTPPDGSRCPLLSFPPIPSDPPHPIPPRFLLLLIPPATDSCSLVPTHLIPLCAYRIICQWALRSRSCLRMLKLLPVVLCISPLL